MAPAVASHDADSLVRADVHHCRLPVRTRRGHGSGSVGGTIDVVILRLQTADGLVGWGEAAPWTVFTGTAEASATALGTHLCPPLIGTDPARISAIMDQAGRRLVGHPEAKAALETALLDIAGKRASVPMSDLLGGRCRDRIALSFSVANPDFGADLEMTRALHDDGVRLFKLKTGVADPATDIARITGLRDAVPEAELRIDYNQGLAPHEAAHVLGPLDEMGLGFIEQPVPVAARRVMADLTRRLKTPILADESVFGPGDAVSALRDDICDLISIKIMKSGGPRAGQAIAAIAATAGVACYGGDMFETGIAHLAGTHMIAATPNIGLGCEFYQATHYLVEDLLAEPFPIEDGAVVVPTGPGLGIAVNEEAVTRHAVASVTVSEP